MDKSIKRKANDDSDESDHIQLQIKLENTNINNERPTFDFRGERPHNQPEASKETKKANKTDAKKKEKLIINKNPENMQKPLFDFRNKKNT